MNEIKAREEIRLWNTKTGKQKRNTDTHTAVVWMCVCTQSESVSETVSITTHISSLAQSKWAFTWATKSRSILKCGIA